MKPPLIIGCVVSLFASSACMNMKAYVDPTLQKIHFEDLSLTQDQKSIGVLVEFQRNGEEYAAVNETARKAVLRVLTESKLFSSVSSGVATSDSTLEIVINNTGGETKGSAVATGLTLGAIGTGTIDRYIITAKYHQEGKKQITKEYRHAIHSTIGLKSGPKGLNPMTVSEAFDKVVEETVLLLLYELQEVHAL